MSTVSTFFGRHGRVVDLLIDTEIEQIDELILKVLHTITLVRCGLLALACAMMYWSSSHADR